MKKGHTLGIILILIGVVWILKQTGIMSVNWAASIKTLWPIFLVAIGATIILGSRRRLITGIWILAFALLIGFGIYKRNEPNRLFDFQKNFKIDLGPIAETQKEPIKNEIPFEQGTDEGRLILKLEASKLSLTKGSEDLLAKVDSNIPKLEQRLSGGEQTVLEYSHESNETRITPYFNLEMNPFLQWEIDASMGVVDGKMDFAEIPVNRIDLAVGAGDMDIIIGEQQETTDVNLHAGAAKLDIYIPKGTGVKLKSGKILTDLDFHNITMIEEDDTLVSDNYYDAIQKIDIEIVTAMSSIDIFTQ